MLKFLALDVTKSFLSGLFNVTTKLPLQNGNFLFTLIYCISYAGLKPLQVEFITIIKKGKHSRHGALSVDL